jgi:hypothetical protein
MMICMLICVVAWASDSPKGTVPRTVPDKYDAHAEQMTWPLVPGVLTPKQARKVSPLM